MKWLAVTVIIVLVVGVVGVGYLFLQETNKLGEAEAEIVSLEGNVASLEGNVSSLEGTVSTLEGNGFHPGSRPGRFGSNSGNLRSRP